jgi:Abi-like protein
MYIASVRGAKDPTERLRKATKLYEGNTTLSEAMYTVMQGFEVRFRNAIHNRLTADHKTTWWFDIFALLPDEQDGIAQARRMIEGKPQTVTPDRIVGELSFGFWVKLFSGEYADTMWGASLKNILPAGSERGPVYSRFKDLKTLRNRIAHHTRIIGRSLTAKQSYEQTLETIGWLDTTVRDGVAATNNVPLRLGKPIFQRPVNRGPKRKRVAAC